MRDCVNAAMRDRLPDLVHDLLPAGERETVLAHLSACADCAAEVELLRDLRVALDAAPAVNVSRIVAALPSPASPFVHAPTGDPTVIPIASRRRPRRMMSWQAAAAIATLMVGGSSLGIFARQQRQEQAVTPPVVAVTTPAASPSAPPTADAPTQGAAAPDGSPAPAGSTTTRVADIELAPDALLADASDAELLAIIDDIEHFDGTPVAEPEPVAPGVTGSTTGTTTNPGTSER